VRSASKRLPTVLGRNTSKTGTGASKSFIAAAPRLRYSKR
jgi:hypothetical protein